MLIVPGLYLSVAYVMALPLVIGLVGPVYACAGFMLYLNRRIETEGRDIELGFRALTARLGRKTS